MTFEARAGAGAATERERERDRDRDRDRDRPARRKREIDKESITSAYTLRHLLRLCSIKAL